MSHHRSLSNRPVPLKPLSAEQLAGLAQACLSEGPLAAREHAVLALLTTTGLRACELCALALDHLHAGFLTVPTAQTGRTRDIRLTDATAGSLRTYITRYRHPCPEGEPSLFLTPDGRPLDVVAVEHIVQGAAARAQLSDRHITVALIHYSVGALRFGSRAASATKARTHDADR